MLHQGFRTNKDGVNSHCQAREFSVGQQIMAQNFQGGLRWIPGIVIEHKGGRCGGTMWIIYVNFILLEQKFRDIILNKEPTKMIGHQYPVRVPLMNPEREIQQIVMYKRNQLKLSNCQVWLLGFLPTVYLS